MKQAYVDGVFGELIMQQLASICESAGFANSTRLRSFLRYTVEQTIEGHGEALKEYAIGVEVYGRKDSYDPGQDSIVRTEARRLRNKLREYYEKDGHDTEVFIYFRLGSYRPSFRKLDKEPAAPLQANAAQTLVASRDSQPGMTFAVLPFVDAGDSSTMGGFAAGITDEIMNRISLTDGCRVVSADPLRKIPKSLSDLSDIGRDLKAQQILFGSTQTDGAQIRIIVHGLNPITRETWTERLQAEVSDGGLLEIQEDVASTLMARISPHHSEVKEYEEPVDLACVALFPDIFSAEALLDSCDPIQVKGAAKRFNNLVKRFPESARIRCGLVQSHFLAAVLGDPIPAATISEAKVLALQAIEIDGRMGQAHAALGCVQALEFDLNGARRSFVKALDLAALPDPVPRQSYAHVLMALDDYDEAFAQLRMAQSMDPFSGQQKLACAKLKYLSGRAEALIQLHSHVTNYGKTPSKALIYEAQSQVDANLITEALETAEIVLKNASNSPALLADVAFVFVRAGHMPEAEALISRCRLLETTTKISRMDQARLCHALGQSDRCKHLLVEAGQRREPQLWTLGTDPNFIKLRNEAWFRRLLFSLKSERDMTQDSAQ